MAILGELGKLPVAARACLTHWSVHVRECFMQLELLRSLEQGASTLSALLLQMDELVALQELYLVRRF